MVDRPPPPPGTPGTWLVIGVLAAAVLVTTWMRARRVAAPSSVASAAATHLPPWPDMRIDINTADAAELNVLPGIGPRLAERIVADREARGPFASLDDLARVRGVGPRTVERIRTYIVAEEPKAES